MTVALVLPAAHVFDLGFMNFGDELACAHFGKIHFGTSIEIGIWKVACPTVANSKQECHEIGRTILVGWFRDQL